MMWQKAEKNEWEKRRSEFTLSDFFPFSKWYIGKWSGNSSYYLLSSMFSQGLQLALNSLWFRWAAVVNGNWKIVFRKLMNLCCISLSAFSRGFLFLWLHINTLAHFIHSLTLSLSLHSNFSLFNAMRTMLSLYAHTSMCDSLVACCSFKIRIWNIFIRSLSFHFTIHAHSNKASIHVLFLLRLAYILKRKKSGENEWVSEW